MAASEGRADPPAIPSDHWWSGWDRTPGIVSVDASEDGRARVWRRVAPDRVVLEEHAFPHWLLSSTLEFFAYRPRAELSAADLRAAHGRLTALSGLHVVRLDGGDARDYRYLVLADTQAELETAVLERWNKRSNVPATSLDELPGLVAAWPPVEQFLLLTGLTYFKGLPYAGLRRLQFDLETTGLNEERDRIFMVSLRDSTGWRASLDTGAMSEAELIDRFVRLVRERDPDVLENHNIFAFDLRFLVRRAAALGVRLALGRDGSEPVAVGDQLRLPNRTEKFVRWRVAGREVIDTLHAVKRYGVLAPDLRRYGLKDVARYFGFAKPDREYVPGAEIWNTFQRDPERVRRYAGDDVEEADGLSQRLMPPVAALTSILPRRYEQVATDLTPQGLVEPLLVRAYLHEARALPPRPNRSGRSSRLTPPRAELLGRGIVRNVVRVRVQPLATHLLDRSQARPVDDRLGAFPWLVRELHRRQRGAERTRGAAGDALEELTRAIYPYLASPGSQFGDARLAAEVLHGRREVIEDVLRPLRADGVVPIEIDGEHVLLSLPTSDLLTEERLLQSAAAALPGGLSIEPDGRFAAAYVCGERCHMLLNGDGTVSMVGAPFRPGVQERFGDQFLREAAPLVLREEPVALRALFLETVARLRAHAVPLEDLSLQATLYKSPAEYRSTRRREEAYEIALNAGLRGWRAGQRIRYFYDRSGRPRLLEEGDGAVSGEADVEHYVTRLRTVYCHHFAYAFTPEDFHALFRVPAPDGRDGHAGDRWADLAAIHPVLAGPADGGQPT